MQKINPPESLPEKLKSLVGLGHFHNPYELVMDIVENLLMF